VSIYVSTATFFLVHCDEWDRVVALPRHKFVTGATLLQLPSKRKKYLCKYQKAWEAEFSWLSHSDRSINDAYCILCKSHLLDPVQGMTWQGMQSHKTICSWRWFKGFTEFRSDLNNDTICGLLSCKFSQNQCCYEYQPSASVLKSAECN
jgi:hypothetical protein